MINSLLIGFSAVFTPACLLLIVWGVVMGIIFGAIPGLSATTAIVLCLPLTYKMTDIQGMALLVSLFIGGISGGLISAILRLPENNLIKRKNEYVYRSKKRVRQRARCETQRRKQNCPNSH